jgi:hypothetical protein
MRALLVLLQVAARVAYTALKVVVVFHASTLRELAAAVTDEVNAVRAAEPDDWGR